MLAFCSAEGSAAIAGGAEGLCGITKLIAIESGVLQPGVSSW